MKITTPKTNFGYYGWRTSVELTDEQVAFFASLGILQFMQRSPATNAEKVLGKFEKRPDTFKRSDIPFSDSDKSIFVREMSTPHEIENNGAKFTISPVTECWFHDLGATKEPAYATEKKAIARHVADGDFLDWIRDTVGYSGEVDRQPENDTKVLEAIKVFKIQKLAEAGM